ncbi:hypothetical protein KFK09_028586 [Dendrobium nobile]|uniref:Uncharacterized protein n=1 Tax=Dendrobium nobile TaxID=94219 RepID=A0A8T3A3I3_DENNO|nr:hypothetical protein KFK09_028586 [Dendrobium nobile]
MPSALLPAAPPADAAPLRRSGNFRPPSRSTPHWILGKRKVSDIDDDDDMTFIDTIGEEDSLEDPFSEVVTCGETKEIRSREEGWKELARFSKGEEKKKWTKLASFSNKTCREYEKPTVNSRKRSTKAMEKPPKSHGKTIQMEPEEAATRTKEARMEPKHQGRERPPSTENQQSTRETKEPRHGKARNHPREPKSHPREPKG